jgi:GntR family transcriptional regulator
MSALPDATAAALPLYARLKADLLRAIASGALPVGARLPSHHELTAHYGMSYMTVRRAISELANEGVLATVRGKGVFVAAPKPSAEAGPLVGFSEDMARRGLRPSSRVLVAELIAAPPALAPLFGLPTGAPLIHLARLRMADAAPIAVQTSYLPHERCPWLLAHDLATASLFELLRRAGLRPAQASGSVSAALASAEEAALLGLVPPAALLITEQRTCLADGSVIEWARTRYRGDRYQLPRQG